MEIKKKQPKRKPAVKREMLHISPKKKTRSNYIDSSLRSVFYRAYEATSGNISASAEIAGLKRMTVYRWLKSTRPINVKFQQRLEQIQPKERFIDFAEAALQKRIEAGDTTAIIFALKAKGRDRGWKDNFTVQEQDLIMRAVTRTVRLVDEHKTKKPDYSPSLSDIKKFAQIAAVDFGISAEAVEVELEKRFRAMKQLQLNLPNILDSSVGLLNRSFSKGNYKTRLCDFEIKEICEGKPVFPRNPYLQFYIFLEKTNRGIFIENIK